MQTGARFPENLLFRLGTEKGPQHEPQIDPTTAPRGPKNGARNRSHIDVAADGPPRAAQRPPGSHFGAILAPFWAPRAPKSSPSASQDALGARLLPHTASGHVFHAFLTPPDPRKSCSRAGGSVILRKSASRAGGRKRGPKITPKINSKNDPKTLPGGQK